MRSAPTAERKIEFVHIDFIEVHQRSRSLNEQAIARLAESMNDIGLGTPISLRYFIERPLGFPAFEIDGDAADDAHVLMVGAHRLAAAKKLGWEKIECFVHYDGDEIDAQLWEIAENLHRAELTKLERDEQITQWIELSARKKPAQLEPVSGGRGNQGGVRAASRVLGIEKEDARRAVKVAGLSPEAKQAAKDAGLDDNRGALLAAAKHKEPEAQIAALTAVRAERDQRKNTNDAERNAARASLPQVIRDRESAKQQAIAGRGGLSAEHRIAELEEAVCALEAEAEKLRSENKSYGDMRVQFEQGGFEKVLAGKDEEIRVLKTRLYRESADKASWARNAKWWKDKAISLGWSNDEIVPLDEPDDGVLIIPLDDDEAGDADIG